MESDLYNDEHEESSQSPVSFSVNYLPLSSTYRQYLIRSDIPPNTPNS